MADEVTPVSPDETVSESASEEAAEEQERAFSDEPVIDAAPPPPFLTRLRALLFGRDDAETRLHGLTYAISLHPDAPTNYVLRGELYLEVGLPDLATVDFNDALQLASEQVETKRWGLVAQAMQDRARVGLKKAQRQLRKHAES